MARKTRKYSNGIIAAEIPSRSVTPEQRHEMIANVAYYRALQRGFEGGDPIDDWLQAEREIDGILLNPERGDRSTAAPVRPVPGAARTGRSHVPAVS